MTLSEYCWRTLVRAEPARRGPVAANSGSLERRQRQTCGSMGRSCGPPTDSDYQVMPVLVARCITRRTCREGRQRLDDELLQLVRSDVGKPDRTSSETRPRANTRSRRRARGAQRADRGRRTPLRLRIDAQRFDPWGGAAPMFEPLRRLRACGVIAGISKRRFRGRVRRARALTHNARNTTRCAYRRHWSSVRRRSAYES